MNNTPNQLPQTSPRFAALLSLALLLFAVLPGHAAIVTLTNSDNLNFSSFTAGHGITNWDNGLAPFAGNDYFVAGGRAIRTPTNSLAPGAYVFAGDSLTLGAGTSSGGSILFKTSNTLTIANLILTNGTLNHGDGGGNPNTVRLAGNILVVTNGILTPNETNRTIKIFSSISGAGGLTISGRGVASFNNTHSYSGPLTVLSTLAEWDTNAVIRPSSLIVGKDGTLIGATNVGLGTFNTNTIPATNLARAGAQFNVGYGPADEIRIGWRNNNSTNNSPLGVLDVSAQNSFNANVGNFIIGFSGVSSFTTTASALGLVFLATNNYITATNILMGDTSEGTHQGQHRLVFGSGSNVVDSGIMTIGARKQRVLMTLPAGGTLLLTNSVTGRMDFNLGANAVGTSANPTDTADLSGGAVKAYFGNLVVGLKSGGSSGGSQSTLTFATNSANLVDANDITLGSMNGNASGTTSANGTLNWNGGTLRINNLLNLAVWDAVAGTSVGTLNLNAGLVNLYGDTTDGGGTSTINVNGGVIDCFPAGDSFAGNLSAKTLVLNGVVSNAFNINVATLRGTGASRNQTGVTTVTGTLDPGTSSTPGTLTMGSVTFSPGATFRVNLTNNTTVGSGVNDLLIVNGDLDLGNATLAINQLAGGLAVGTYRLAEYTGEALNTLTLPSVGRYSLSLQTDTVASPKRLNLVVSGNPFALVWSGHNSSAWDINTTQNWTNQLNAADVFFDNDNVRFTDVSANPNVTLDVAAQPGSVLFSNNVNSYVVSGAGKITGPAGLTKQGTGTVTMNTTNDFDGPVTLSAGLFVAGSDGALGSTNGGTLIASGATLDVQTNKFTNEIVQVSGPGYNGQGAIINSDGANTFGARNALRLVSLNGNTTFGGSGRWDIRGNGPTGSASLIGPAHTVSKVGSNGVYFTDGAEVNVAAIQVTEGNITVEAASIVTNTAAITISSNAVLSFYRLYNPFAPNVTLLDQSTIRSTDANTNAQNVIAGQLNLVSGEIYVNATGNATNVLKLAGRVTGGGTLVKTGGQTVELLNPTNNWTGGTVVSNGTLSVGNGLVNGSLPVAPFVITNYANLMYNVASNTTVTTAHEITGIGSVTKRGDGILSLTLSNSFTGKFFTGDGAPTSGGIVRFLHPAAFGDPSLSKTVSVIRAEIRLDGTAQIPSTVYLETSANSDATGAGAGYVALRNTAGNNVIAGTVELIGGAGASEYSSDAGTLTFNGPVYLGAATTSRAAIFSGAANGTVNGEIGNLGAGLLSVEKRGAGTWTLNVSNSYGGTTLVKGGTLLVQGSIAGNGVSVTNGFLGGNGVINAGVVVSNVGTLAPGTSVGKLTINSNLALYASALMEVARNGAALTNDQAAGVITCTYGGQLIVTNVGASALQAGDSFQLFAASSYAGAFTNIVYPAGYNWTNTLATDGRVAVLSVIAPPNTNPPAFPPGGITRQGGGIISLVGTGAVGTPYTIWASTNVAARPISNTWTILTNGTISSSPFTNLDTTAPNFPRRFYLFSTP